MTSNNVLVELKKKQSRLYRKLLKTDSAKQAFDKINATGTQWFLYKNEKGIKLTADIMSTLTPGISSSVDADYAPSADLSVLSQFNEIVKEANRGCKFIGNMMREDEVLFAYDESKDDFIPFSFD